MRVMEDDYYDDPPKIEERRCGTCLMFTTDTDPSPVQRLEGWGRCVIRNISVTARMQVVLKRNETTCYMEAPS